jgi:hypothetical protein
MFDYDFVLSPSLLGIMHLILFILGEDNITQEWLSLVTSDKII